MARQLLQVAPGVEIDPVAVARQQEQQLQQQQQQQQAAVSIAQPMNDVQNISLCAAMLSSSGFTTADKLLDLATEIVAGAYARVNDGRFAQAMLAARIGAV